jgi:hypothetical protein
MSAKRSWDIRPSTARRAARPDPVIPARKPVTSSISLRERRRRARSRLLILLGIVLVLVIGGCIYGLWRPAVRIAHINLEGPDADALLPLVEEAISGTYAHVLPKNSIVFFPAQSIRNAILDAYPDVAAVSVHREGTDAIRVTTIGRVSAFDWCGEDRGAAVDAACYKTDAEGFIFAPEDPVLTDASSTPTYLRVYAPLTASSTGGAVRSTVAQPELVPSVLRFERALMSLGALIESVQLRGDEADLYTRAGTRITYVLGHEETAAQLAATTFPQLNVNDGSVIYVDLRFDGKVYFKKAGE